MPIINLKLYFYAALAVGLIALVLRYDYVVEKSERLEKENAQWAANAKERDRIAELTDKARIDAINQLEAAKYEIKKRDDCIASGACKRVVRVKQACSLPQAEAASGVEDGFAELAPSVQRAASNFEVKLVEQESKLALCLAFARGVAEQDKK